MFGAVDAGPPCRIRRLGQRQERRGSSQTQASEPALSAPNSALATRWTQGGRQNTDSAGPGKALDADYPVDVVRHCQVLFGDAALGMCHERECHCPPTDIDIGMMVFGFGVFAYPTHGVDTGKERRKLDRSAQGTLLPFPPVEVRQCGVDLLIR